MTIKENGKGGGDRSGRQALVEQLVQAAVIEMKKRKEKKYIYIYFETRNEGLNTHKSNEPDCEKSQIDASPTGCNLFFLFGR